MTSRGGRALGAVALLACLLAPVAAGSAGASPHRAAAATEGACPTAAGVTVVIDFHNLKTSDGSTHPSIVRCTTSAPSNGFDALTKAGVTFQVITSNPGFLCRIDGLPSSPSYASNCGATPPTSAYWGYWVATRGGGWCYSQVGAGARKPPQGTVEGWSFSSGTVEGGTPPSPTVPGHVTGAPGTIDDGSCPSPPATTTTTTQRPATTAPTSPPGDPGGPAGTTTTTRRPPGSPDTTAGGDGPAATDTSTSSPNESSTSSSTSSTATGGTVTIRVADDDGGSPVATALGGGAVVAIAAAALLTARRRRQQTDRDEP